MLNRPFPLLWLALAAPATLGAVSLTVWNQPPEARPAERQLWDQEAAEFSQASGIEVKPIARDYIQQQFVSVMAGGKGPDVAHVWVGALPTLARQGLLAPLDDEVKGWSQAAYVPQALWDPAKVDGHIYGVPRDSYTYILLVRRDLWVKAGLDPAVPPANWDALEADAKRMTDPQANVAGFGFAPTAEAFMDFVWQAGGDLLCQQGGATRACFHQNPGITAMTFLRRMRFDDGSMQTDPLASREQLAQLFALGRVAMIMGVPDQMPDLISRYGLSPKDLLLFPLPAGPTGIQATHAGGDYYVVNAGSDPAHQAAAWAYIQAMLDPLNQFKRYKRMQALGIPLFPGAFSTTAQLNNLPEFKLVQDTLATARREPYLPNWPQIKDYLETTLLERLFTERDADVEGLMRKAAEDVDELYL
jgi:ABC-type glycerol-3-phosphate transport system substrate-binding protein